MLQKLIVGFLGVTVLGAAGVGIYDSTQSNPHNADNAMLANADQVHLTGAPIGVPQVAAPQVAAPQAALTATPAVLTAQDGTVPVQRQQALTMVGDPWTAAGTIASFDTNGMTLTLSDSSIYVELGPSHYWQAQAVTLAAGDLVSVAGFYNGDQYHAAVVTKTDGAQLVVRTADGLPLWSGGASGGQNQQGATNGNTAGQTQEPVVAPEDWVMLNATVIAVNRSTLDVQTEAGAVLSLQLGQASFLQSQGVIFAAGDALSVTGYWQGTTFRAGDITKLATGERVMLLDPNGRPLWSGPGRTGTQGQGGQGQTNAGAQSQGTTGAQVQGQSTTTTQGGGNGKGYRGGRG